MMLLSLFWLLLGIIVGLVALGAALNASWRGRWYVVLVIGALAALCGGWLGTLLLGRYFATAMALWVAVVGVVGVLLVAWFDRTVSTLKVFRTSDGHE